MGVVIVKTLLDNLKVNLQGNSDVLLGFDQEALLLNLIFHHHNFIYAGPEKSGNFEKWLNNEIDEKLIPTMPENRPDLIVRFFCLLFHLRHADISATKEHHKHWPVNYQWFGCVPDFLSKKFDTSEEFDGQIEILRRVIGELPGKIDAK